MTTDFEAFEDRIEVKEEPLDFDAIKISVGVATETDPYEADLEAEIEDLKRRLAYKMIENQDLKGLNETLNGKMSDMKRENLRLKAQIKQLKTPESPNLPPIIIRKIRNPDGTVTFKKNSPKESSKMKSVRQGKMGTTIRAKLLRKSDGKIQVQSSKSGGLVAVGALNSCKIHWFDKPDKVNQNKLETHHYKVFDSSKEDTQIQSQNCIEKVQSPDLSQNEVQQSQHFGVFRSPDGQVQVRRIPNYANVEQPQQPEPNQNVQHRRPIEPLISVRLKSGPILETSREVIEKIRAVHAKRRNIEVTMKVSSK